MYQTFKDHLRRLILRDSYDDDMMRRIKHCTNEGLVPNPVYVFSSDSRQVCTRECPSIGLNSEGILVIISRDRPRNVLHVVDIGSTKGVQPRQR